MAALKQGTITEEDIDARNRALLQLLHRVGKFSDRQDTPAEQAINRSEHKRLIREVGGAGCVLLKNKDQLLPIDIQAIKKIAVLRPLADHASAHGSGSSLHVTTRSALYKH